MKKLELKEGWFNELGREASETIAITSARRRAIMEKAPAAKSEIPAFTGMSQRPLMRKKELLKRLGVCSSFLSKKIKEGMIHPQPLGGRICFTEEEVENYLRREQIKYGRKLA
jgi:predicted DNA-binding transcriptional regulator AlpA